MFYIPYSKYFILNITHDCKKSFVIASKWWKISKTCCTILIKLIQKLFNRSSIWPSNVFILIINCKFLKKVFSFDWRQWRLALYLESRLFGDMSCPYTNVKFFFFFNKTSLIWKCKIILECIPHTSLLYTFVKNIIIIYSEYYPRQFS